MFKKILALSLLTTSSFALKGGGQGGNGGHGIFCRKPNGFETAYFVDTYEARQRFGIKPKFKAGKDFVWDKVRWPSRLIAVAEYRFKKILPPDHVFFESFEFIKAVTVGKRNVKYFDMKDASTDDLGSFEPLPEGCYVRQIAIAHRTEDRIDLDINPYVLNRLSSDDRAILFLHEGFHLYMGSEVSTLAVRELVWWVIAPDEFRERNKHLVQKIISTRQAVDPLLFK